MKKILLFAFIGMTAALMNCSTDAKVCVKEVSATTIAAIPQAQLILDIGKIKSYSASVPNVVNDPSGLSYKVTTLGTGDTPCLSSTIAVTYSGKVLQQNGTLAVSNFDASATVVSFPLSNLILGWQIAFPKFPAGTTATLYVPSGMAYGLRVQTGTNGQVTIPASSVLVFEVTLVAFAN